MNQDNNINKLKKTFKIITVIILLLGLSGTIYYVLSFFTINNTESIGIIIKYLAIGLAISFLLYTGIAIGILWLIYFIIKRITKYYQNQIPDKKETLKKNVLIILSLSLIIIIPIYNIISSNKRIEKVMSENPNISYLENNNYYFVYNNKIYYYQLYKSVDYTKMYDRLYEMNLDGSNNIKIAETDELRFADFYFVYNNEAYYYTTYYDDNKKINLKTGKITSLGTKEIYIPKTLNNNTVCAFDPYAGEDYSTFRKIDLKTNTIISEVKSKHKLSNKQYYFDYDVGYIYYIDEDESVYPTLYQNNQVFYEFTKYNKNNFPETDIIAINDKYIYLYQNKTIYKLNINEKTIEKEINNTIGDFKRIGSGNNTDNYFYSNNNIYSFNIENDVFELILNNINKAPTYVYNTKNELIFTEYTNNNYNSDVIIYNKETKKTERIEEVNKISFDEKHMYLIQKINNKYNIKTIELK